MKATAWQQSWDRLARDEKRYAEKYAAKNVTALSKMLEEKVPEKLQAALRAAFSKAFETVFERGTGLIERTFDRAGTEREYKINRYALTLKRDKKSLRSFSKNADAAGRRNALFAGAEGVGLGLLGIGLPDIPLFVGMLLKSIYEVALGYGYSYETPEEKQFILRLIATALSYGDELAAGDARVDAFIADRRLPENHSPRGQLDDTAAILSAELLYMKFLQGIPIVGAVGGLSDTICLQRVLKYARLKYERRFLLDGKHSR